MLRHQIPLLLAEAFLSIAWFERLKYFSKHQAVKTVYLHEKADRGTTKILLRVVGKVQEVGFHFIENIVKVAGL